MRKRYCIPQTYYALCRLLSNYFNLVIRIELSLNKLKSNQTFSHVNARLKRKLKLNLGIYFFKFTFKKR